METYHMRSRMRFWWLLLCLTVLGSVTFLPFLPQEAVAQTVSIPNTRHTVLYQAYRYVKHHWYLGGQEHWGVPYAWGYADWIDASLGPGTHNCSAPPSLFQDRLDHGCYTGCNTNAGADCSGYVMRIWGRPTTDAKWDTSAVASHSIAVPCRAGQEQCTNTAVRNEDLPKRMRMGDVFDDWYGAGRHVVLLYYLDPQNNNVPYYYEENPDGDCTARLNKGGWTWLQNHGGWWNGTDGYRPYRYTEIRDDIYLPWLAHDWATWESTLYFRNNNIANLWPTDGYVMQHTIYSYTGADQGAINKTYRRTFTRDILELPTSILNPGSNYVGWGVADADAGGGAVVYMEASQNYALAYTGIFPFDSLGMGLSEQGSGGLYHLYMPLFMYFSPSLYSKLLVQNASGSQVNDITHLLRRRWPDLLPASELSSLGDGDL
jgi:hypothetical protein